MILFNEEDLLELKNKKKKLQKDTDLKVLDKDKKVNRKSMTIEENSISGIEPVATPVRPKPMLLPHFNGMNLDKIKKYSKKAKMLVDITWDEEDDDFYEEDDF